MAVEARVLMVTPRYPPFTGGVETHVAEVCPRLARMGFDVCVLTTDVQATRPTERRENGVTVHRVPAWPRNRDYMIAPDIFRRVQLGEWDILHVQSYHTAVAPLAMAAAIRSGGPFVLTFHGGGHSSRLRQAVRRPQRALLRPLIARASRLIALAEFERDLYARELHIPVERFTVIPNGSDLPISAVPSSRRPDDPPLIVSLGRLERYKGHHLVLAAFPEFLARRPGSRLWIAGEGPFEGELRRQTVRLNVTGNVQFGAVPAHERARLAEALSRASLVCLMSEFETQPLAAMESLALGIPLLVADSPGLQQLAQDGLARAVPRRLPPPELAAAMLEEVERQRQPPPVELPTWDTTAGLLAETYRETLEANGRGAGPPPPPPSEASGERHAPVVAARPRPAPPPEPPDSPAGAGGPDRLRFAVCALLTSLGLLVASIADALSRSGRADGDAVFWAGVVLMLAPCSMRLFGRSAGRGERIALVLLAGLGVYLLKVLNDPTMFAYADELVHAYNAESIVRTGALFTHNPILTVTPDYPGLEAITAALASVTGIGTFAAGVIVVGAARVLMMLALFLLVETLTHSPRYAGLASLIYVTGPNFVFFTGQFSYESLALPLMVATLYAVVRWMEPEAGDRAAWTVTAALSMMALVVTHHMTAYVLVTALLVISIANRLLGRPRSPFAFFALGLVLTAAWLTFVASNTVGYLSPVITRSIRASLSTFAAEAPHRTPLVSGSGAAQPLVYRMIAVATVVLVALGVAASLRLLWRGERPRHPVTLLLAASGAAFVGALATRLAPGAWEAANRSSEFFYIGVSFLLAGLVVDRWTTRRFGPLLFAALLCLVFAGGVVISHPSNLLLAQPLEVKAGSATLPSPELGASRWVRRSLGVHRRIAADKSSGRLLLGEDEAVLIGPHPNIAGILTLPRLAPWQLKTLRRSAIRYVVINRLRISSDQSRGYFFCGVSAVPCTAYLPQQYGKFDRVPSVSRIFDNGTIAVYDVGRLTHAG